MVGDHALADHGLDIVGVELVLFFTHLFPELAVHAGAHAAQLTVLSNPAHHINAEAVVIDGQHPPQRLHGATLAFGRLRHAAPDRWFLDFEPGEADDAHGFRLADEVIQTGGYLSLSTGDQTHTYVVARAEPVATLYACGRVRHCGRFAALEDEIRAHVRGRLAPYEYPKEIEFIDALPKSGSGKVMWRALQEAEMAKA